MENFPIKRIFYSLVFAVAITDGNLGSAPTSVSAQSLLRPNERKEFSEGALRRVYVALVEGSFGAPYETWFPRVIIQTSQYGLKRYCLRSGVDENHTLLNTCIPQPLLRALFYAMANVTSRHVPVWPRVLLDDRELYEANAMNGRLDEWSRSAPVLGDAETLQVAKNYCDADICRAILSTSASESSSSPPWTSSSSPSPPSPSPPPLHHQSNEEKARKGWKATKSTDTGISGHGRKRRFHFLGEGVRGLYTFKHDRKYARFLQSSSSR